MHLAIDMDDVLLDLCGGMKRSTKIEFGIDVPLAAFWDKDFVVPDGRKLFGPDLLGSYDDQESWLREKNWIWATFPPVDGALGGLRELRNAGHHVEIVTAKPEWGEWITWKWLGRWRPPVHAVTIVPLGANKSEYTDATVIVDDSVRNCTDFIKAGRHAVLFDRPWNRESVLPRAFGWKDIPELVTHAFA